MPFCINWLNEKYCLLIIAIIDVELSEIGICLSFFSLVSASSGVLKWKKLGFSMKGKTVYCPLADGRTIAAEIVSSVFYDPKGERQNVE